MPVSAYVCVYVQKALESPFKAPQKQCPAKDRRRRRRRGVHATSRKTKEHDKDKQTTEREKRTYILCSDVLTVYLFMYAECRSVYMAFTIAIKLF